MRDLHMSQEAGLLTISLFLAGYCIGPLLWGPLSEQVRGRDFNRNVSWSTLCFQYGRRPIFVWTFIAYTVRSEFASPYVLDVEPFFSYFKLVPRFQKIQPHFSLCDFSRVPLPQRH
jgi:MFS family permease